ncbi:MAG: phasin family protein [Burkholderiales bacterium]
MSTPPETTVKAPGFDWADAAQHWFQACRGGFDAWLALCNAALAGAERVRMAQLEADVETQARNRSAALAAGECRDFNGLLALQANLATAYAESAMRYARTCAELGQQTNAEMARILGGRLEEWNRLMRAAFPAAAAPGALQPPFVVALEAARASQEAMMSSIAALGVPSGAAQKRAA